MGEPHAKETLPFLVRKSLCRDFLRLELVFFSSLDVTANTLFPGSLMSVDRKKDLWERSGPRTDPATTPHMRPWANLGTSAISCFNSTRCYFCRGDLNFYACFPPHGLLRTIKYLWPPYYNEGSMSTASCNETPPSSGRNEPGPMSRNTQWERGRF